MPLLRARDFVLRKLVKVCALLLCDVGSSSYHEVLKPWLKEKAEKEKEEGKKEELEKKEEWEEKAEKAEKAKKKAQKGQKGKRRGGCVRKIQQIELGALRHR